MSRFRDFVYLEIETIDSFLSSVEDGLYDSEDRETEISGSGNPYFDSLENDSTTTSDRRRRRLQQNGPSKFSRLVKYIEDDPEERIVRTGGEYEHLLEGAFCQLSGEVEVPDAVAAMAISKDFLSLGKTLQGFGLNLIDESDMQKIEAVSEASEHLGNRVSVLMDVPGLKQRVVLSLRKDTASARFYDLSGNLTVFGRVSSLVKHGDSYKLLEIPGERHMSRQQRRAVARGKDIASASFDGREIKGPAIILNAIAIYR